MVTNTSFVQSKSSQSWIFHRIIGSRLKPVDDIYSSLAPAVCREEISVWITRKKSITLRVMTTIRAGVNMMIVVPRKRLVVPLHDVYTIGWVAFRINVQSVAFPPELSERF